MQVDTFLRTIQQHHVQLSLLADTKASILITIASIIVTFAFSRAGDLRYRSALMTLTAACLLSLLLAVLAIIPNFAGISLRKPKRPNPFNILFFGHFALMSEDEFLKDMKEILSSEELLQRTALHDIYTLGTYLYYKKYRFLRYAYFSLLIGFIAASAVQGWVIFQAP